MSDRKAKLGQNFLIDESCANRIVEASNIDPSEHILEIGPGRGALTGKLIDRAASVTAMEIDAELADRLRRTFAGEDKLTVMRTDALKEDFDSLPGDKYKAVSNLPYNISSPLVRKLISGRQRFTAFYLLFQEEVAEKVCGSEPGRRGYLSIFTGFYCRARMLFRVPPGAFRPAPKVDSRLVEIVPRDKPLLEIEDEERFFDFVKVCFRHRRKTVARNLKLAGVDKKRLTDGELPDCRKRPEELSIGEFAVLFDKLKGAAVGID